MEKFVQKSRRAVRDSGYKKMPLVKEFKREMNGIIRRKLMKTEWPSRSINQ